MLVPTTTLHISLSGAAPWTLIGRSWANDGTSLAIPELKLLFDCGAPVVPWRPTVAFVSHTHNDHIQSLPSCVLPSKSGSQNTPITLHVPSPALPFLERYLHAHQELIDCAETLQTGEEKAYGESLTLVPHEPGEEFVFRQGGKEFVCRTLKCEHRIPCLGYSLFVRKHTLRDEYRGLPGKEIGALRKQGVQITDCREEPVVCLLGDTTTAVFETYPNLLSQHKVVVVECTFIDDKEMANAELHKHVHWKSLKPYVDRHPSTLFILIHFSTRHASKELRKFFVEQTPHRNVHPFLLEEDIAREAAKSRDATPVPGCNCFLCCPD